MTSLTSSYGVPLHHHGWMQAAVKPHRRRTRRGERSKAFAQVKEVWSIREEDKRREKKQRKEKKVSMTGHSSATGPTVMLVQLPNGQTVQVCSVIQATQPSVIQSTQISATAEGEESVDNVTQKPQASNRKIPNGLSPVWAVPCVKGVKVEEDSCAVSAAPTVVMDTVSTPIYHISSGQYIAFTQCGAIQLANNTTDRVQGRQTLALTEAPAAAAAQPRATILQYARASDGQQKRAPSNHVLVKAASSEVQTKPQGNSVGTISPGVTLASTPALPTQSANYNRTCKREVRLMRNREAARECRRKKKEYVECLENRVAVLENQNKTLIGELKVLKDLYCNRSE